MLSAPLMVNKGGNPKLWGTFGFAQPPASGDRIRVLGANGRVQRLSVGHIQHEPLREDEMAKADHGPAWGHADFVDEFW